MIESGCEKVLQAVSKITKKKLDGRLKIANLKTRKKFKIYTVRYGQIK